MTRLTRTRCHRLAGVGTRRGRVADTSDGMSSPIRVLCASGRHRRCPTSAATPRPLRCRSSWCSSLMVRLPMWAFLNASLWLIYLLLGLVVGALARGSFTPVHEGSGFANFQEDLRGSTRSGCGATTPKSSWLPCCEPGEPSRTLPPTTSRSSVTRSRRSPPRTARSCWSAPKAPGHHMTCSTGSPSGARSVAAAWSTALFAVTEKIREAIALVSKKSRCGPRYRPSSVWIGFATSLPWLASSPSTHGRPGRRLRAHPRRSWAPTPNALSRSLAEVMHESAVHDVRSAGDVVGLR